MLYDISPVLSARLPVWPGDIPFSALPSTGPDARKARAAGTPATSAAMDAQKPPAVASAAGTTALLPRAAQVMQTTVHAGAHADAPGHCFAGGATIEACDLNAFIGPCQVLRVAAQRKQAVRIADLPAPVAAPRVLLATGTYDWTAEAFDDGFAGLSDELAEHLAACGVQLVGIDTPSVDVFGAPGLPAHHRLLGKGVYVLEGLNLGGVPTGEYELIALPLRLAGFDGSPVRAVLRT